MQNVVAFKKIGVLCALLEFIEEHWKLIFAILLIIQAAGLIASLIYSDSYSTPDTITYIIPAEKFLTTGIMLDETNTPIWFRTPGYPLVLAIIYWLADLFKINFDKNFIVLGLQALMCILNSCMIFYCVNKIAVDNKKAYGVLAVLFYICDIAVYDNARLIMADVPFSFFITLTALFFIKYYYSCNKLYAVLSILLINYSLWIKPALLYFNMIIAIIIIFALIFKKINWKLGVLYLCVYLAMFGGWCARNAYYHHVTFETIYTPLRVRDAFHYYAPHTYKLIHGLRNTDGNAEKSNAIFNKRLYEKYKNFDELPIHEQHYARGDIGREYIKQHIFAYILLNLKGVITEMLEPDIGFVNSLHVPVFCKALIMLLVSIMLMLCYLIYAVSFLCNIKKLNIINWTIFLLTAYLMASSAAVAHSRFRIMFYTLNVIGTFSSLALFTCFKNFK